MLSQELDFLTYMKKEKERELVSGIPGIEVAMNRDRIKALGIDESALIITNRITKL